MQFDVTYYFLNSVDLAKNQFNVTESYLIKPKNHMKGILSFYRFKLQVGPIFNHFFRKKMIQIC